MKKTIIIALTLILILASFISCENNTHEHTWDKGTVTKAATCTEKGVTTYTCTVCKETKTEDIAIDPENHTWDEGEVTTAATCTEAGLKTFTCTGCKKTITEEIEALGHKWNDGVETTKATYLKKGTLTKTCTRTDCEEIMNIDIPCIPLNGQSFASCYNASNVQIFSLSETNCDLYMGGADKDGNVSAMHFGQGSYSIKGSILTLTIDDQVSLCELEEKISVSGDVVSITMKDEKGILSLVPIELQVKAEPEGHYFIADKQVILPYTTNGNTFDKTLPIKSITIGPLNHQGECEEIKTPGYFTKGECHWDKCAICQFSGKADILLPLVNTKWKSTDTVSSTEPMIDNDHLVLHFQSVNNGTLSNMKGNFSRPFNYSISFDEKGGAILSINSYMSSGPEEDIGGPAEEGSEKDSITINFKNYFNMAKNGEVKFSKIEQ